MTRSFRTLAPFLVVVASCAGDDGFTCPPSAEPCPPPEGMYVGTVTAMGTCVAPGPSTTAPGELSFPEPLEDTPSSRCTLHEYIVCDNGCGLHFDQTCRSTERDAVIHSFITMTRQASGAWQVVIGNRSTEDGEVVCDNLSEATYEPI